MPELPEVETTRQGIEPYLANATVRSVTIRQHSLRWPIEDDLATTLQDQTIVRVSRRAKYLLLHCDSGVLMIHLGMSGSLRVLNAKEAKHINKHDHVDIELTNNQVLRYTDPRRFGAILWSTDPIEQHKLISHLGPEPLTDEFNADYLMQNAQTKKCSIKSLIMNGKIVVGVGNIYASESLFLANIHPNMKAHCLNYQQAEKLTAAVKTVLQRAIQAGGTTLRDFTKSDGKPGYFAQQLNVYGRKDMPCLLCGSIIMHYKEAQRATYYCPLCQKS